MPLAPVKLYLCWIHDISSQYVDIHLPSLKNTLLPNSQDYFNIIPPQTQLFSPSLIRLLKRIIKCLLKRETEKEEKDKDREGGGAGILERESEQDRESEKQEVLF